MDVRQGNEVTAQGREFFQVEDPVDKFRTFLTFNDAGGDTSDTVQHFAENPFQSYNNISHYFAWAPSDFSSLAPAEAEWVAGQWTIRRNKARMLEEIHLAKSLGSHASGYTNATPAGPAGTNWPANIPSGFSARKPALSDTADTPVDPLYVSTKAKPPQQNTWCALVPDLGNPDVVRYGAEQINRSIDMFGWDMIFFDGAYTVRDLSTWDGQPAGRGEGIGKLSLRAVQETRALVRARHPGVGLWYNTGGFTGDPVRAARAETLRDANSAALYEVQGAFITDPNFAIHQWRALYDSMVMHRNELQQAAPEDDPVITFGYMYNMQIKDRLSKKSSRPAEMSGPRRITSAPLVLATRMHPCFSDAASFLLIPSS